MAADITVTSPLSPISPGVSPRAAGTLIAGRFLIEDLAGHGGMGAVYRARDEHTGQPVALKLLHTSPSPEAASRFKREAVVLSELRHPGIVSYITHGATEEDQLFLAMEWLEGEDLARRLLRKPLELSETLALLRRAAEALATPHQQGIVHRDLKPSNLFLRAGRPEDVVLVDFGLARHVAPTQMAVTRSNLVLGTPGYMAPEQASSQADIPPSADIFSLGCVLYECLTGRPPFAAPHFAAVLAKILFTEPAPLRTLRADLPVGLQVLVDRMLVKDPRHRLPDAASLLESLSVLKSDPERLLSGRGDDAYRPSLAGAEQRLVSILLLSLPTLDTNASEEDVPRGRELHDSVCLALEPYGARVALLADGSLVATLVSERGTATDQAMLAARCALTFKERLPEATVVLVTGLGILDERLPVGEAMDKAGQLLRQVEQTPAYVVLDEVTAGLLGSGFQLSRPSGGPLLLQGEQLRVDASRLLLGKPTPCVGREQELALLEFTLACCVDEPAARALLVTAPPGTGKSRLRHEFLRRVESREQPVLLLLGRGDPMSTGATQGLMSQAVRRLCEIVEGENLEARRARLYQRVARHLPAEEAQETIEFLGELCAIPFPDEGSPRLRAARNDPRVMSTQVGRAVVTFLRAECAHQPVLLVLEDLHWSDALTIKLVDEVLRELAEQPVMVLALARPEVKELFPGLWSRRLQELPLNGLSRKASNRLVREMLGPEVPETLVRKAVEQSDGNALFLEEIIRMLAEGRGEAPPETVLAVLQARLSRMEPALRQVLLAASIFGRTFWADGVAALLGTRGVDARLEHHLQRLVELEVIEAQPGSRFRSEAEYRFRHALVRDSAYGLVPDSHRPTGHRLAGDWLDKMGEPDLLELATHYQLGHQPERAAWFYTQAAKRLSEQYDLYGTIRCVEAALACGVEGEPLIQLRALQAVVAFWMNDFATSYEVGSKALSGLRAGSLPWCQLVGALIASAAQSGRQEYAAELARLLLSTPPEAEALPAYVEAVCYLSNICIWTGLRGMATACLARVAEVGAGNPDAMMVGWRGCTQSFFEYFFEPSPWRALLTAEQGTKAFLDIGTDRSAAATQTNVGLALAALGDPSGAVEWLRRSLSTARRVEQQFPILYAGIHLALVLSNHDEASWRTEAVELAHESLRGESSSPLHQGLAKLVLARVSASHGQLAEAEVHASQACGLLAPFPSYLLFARTTRVTTLLSQGRAGEARQQALLGVQELERMDSVGVGAVASYLALAEACFAQGEEGEAEAALRKALRCVRERARDIPEPAARERFLLHVPENARTLALAHQRWGASRA